MRPVENYFYKNQSKIKFEILNNFSYCLRQNDPEVRLSIFAFHLRYIFMVTSADLSLPPYPADQLSEIRAFLEDTYRNPMRAIDLSCEQMEQILRANDKYRVYNSDNYHIVMRHITHPDEKISSVFDDLVPVDEGAILENVLSLLPDAKPAT